MPFRVLMRVCFPLVLLAAIVAAGCSGAGSPPGAAEDPMASLEPESASGSPVYAVVVLGDSLTAGLGLLLEEAYPSRLQDLFMGEGYSEVEIVNAGVSGDTTAGGLRRIGEQLNPTVRIVVVALGGNDALRGLSVVQTRRNLTQIIDTSIEAGAEVLLVGMEAPTNLGEDYRESFRGAYRDIAEEYRGRIRFVPFLLEGVAGMSMFNQADGIHPNAEGARMVAEHLYPVIRDMVDEIPEGPVAR